MNILFSNAGRRTYLIEYALNIKINNKIIHQSKLLKYFEEKYEIEKAEDDLDKLLKSIKKNKDYSVSTKDLITIS